MLWEGEGVSEPSQSVLIKKPDGWELMGWRERAKWLRKNVYNESRTARRERDMGEAYRDIARLHKIRSIGTLKRKDWDQTRVEWFLRLVADKALVGFSIKSVERLATVTEACIEMSTFRPVQLMKSMRKKLEYEMDQIKKACLTEIRSRPGKHNNWDNGESTEDIKGQYKKVANNRYERDGIRYRKINFLVNEDDYLKCKAVLSLENLSYSEWVRLRMRKYVTRQFRRLAEVKGLVDPTIDQSIPDSEMDDPRKEGDSYPNIKTENQGQEKEVTLQPKAGE